MNKTPEEYFQEQELLPEERPQESLTEAEKAFVEKYLGLEDEDILERLGLEAPAKVRPVEVPEAEPEPEAVAEPELAKEAEEATEEVTEETAEEAEESAAVLEDEQEVPEDLALEQVQEELVAEPLEEALKKEPSIRMVSFNLAEREFTVPINAVQEVIRYVPTTKLPGSPAHFGGIVNIRGRVTPLIMLKPLLNIRDDREFQATDQMDEQGHRFIIICRAKGLQLGLLVENVTTMYTVEQEMIEWNIDSRMGGEVEFITALMRKGEELIGVVSVDRIAEKVLKS